MDQLISIMIAIFVSGGVIGYFLRRMIDDKFEEHQYNKQERREQTSRAQSTRRNLAKELIDICVEGHSSGFTKKPQDNAKFFQIVSQLETVDSNAARLYTLLFGTWGIHVLANEKYEGFEKYKDEMFKTAHEARKDLLKIATEWGR